MTADTIIWREGMFIAPQHLQYSDVARRAEMAVLGRLDLSGDDFGLSALKINRDLLAVGKVAISVAEGIFPDRTYFELGKELVLDIADGAVDQVVMLALPLHRSGVRLVGDTLGLDRWIARPVALDDMTDPEAPALETEVAEPGVCLKLSQEDLSGYACIPFARILEKTSEGRVVLDDAYLPTCIAIRASTRLLARLDEIKALAQARAQNAASRLQAARGTQSSTSLIGERFELEMLNRALTALGAAENHPWIAPRRLFGLMSDLLAGMDAHAGQIADPEMQFNAKEPTQSFERVISRLRAHLTLETRASVKSLEWNDELFAKRRLLRLVLPQRLLVEGRRPILAVQDPTADQDLGEVVPLACKLAGISSMPDLVRLGLQGVRLTYLPVAPPELRDRPNTAFFAIDTSSTLWRRFVDEREALGLHVDERIPAPSVTLYMVE